MAERKDQMLGFNKKLDLQMKAYALLWEEELNEGYHKEVNQERMSSLEEDVKKLKDSILDAQLLLQNEQVEVEKRVQELQGSEYLAASSNYSKFISKIIEAIDVIRLRPLQANNEKLEKIRVLLERE